MKHSIRRMFAVALGISLVVSATAQQSPELPVITVGVMADTSGLLKSLGTEIRNAAALNLLRSRPEFRKLGFDLRFKTYNDRSTWQTSARLAETVVADPNVLALVGPVDSVIAENVIPVLAKANLGMVIAASAARLTENGFKNVNRFVASDAQAAQSTARFMRESVGARNVMVVSEPNPYSQTLSSAVVAQFKADGAKVTLVNRREETKLDDALQAISEVKPDAIYIATSGGGGIALIKTLRAQKNEALLFSSDIFTIPAYFQALGPDVRGLYLTVVAPPARAYPAAKNFVADYTRLYKAEPQFAGVLSYDALEVALSAIRKAIADNPGRRPTRLEVQTALRAVNVEGLFSGSVRFNSRGERLNNVVYQLRVGDDGAPRIVDVLKTQVGN